MAGMSLSGIRYIYEARLQARAVLVQEVFAIVGIAVGVALLFASQISGTSLTRSVAQLDTQLVGNAQLQMDARGPEGFPEALLQEVRGVPGVQVALPVFEQQVNVLGKDGERSADLIGIEPRSVRASGPLLRRFSARQLTRLPAIALPAPLADEIGAAPLLPIKLQIGSRAVNTLLAAKLEESDIGGLVHSPLIISSISYAQRLSGASGRLSRIFIHYAPAHAAQVRAGLARLAATANVNLEQSTFDGRLFAVAVEPENKSEELFSGISALVGFMFALNAMLVTVPSRRKLIEDLRPHGATRWMTVQILLFDAFVIGVLACVLGLLLGNMLSIAVFHTTPGYLAFAFPVGSDRIVTWQAVVLAVAAGMSAAIIGVLWPVREILARPLQQRLSVEEPQRGSAMARLSVGLLCLVFTTLALVVDTHAALLGNIALLAALACLLPLLFDGLVKLFERASDLLNGVGSALAVTELQAPQTRVRSLAIAATAAVAVFGIVEFQGTQKNLKHGLDASAYGLDSGADIWITPSGRSSLLTTVPFAQLDAATLRAVPGVRQVGEYRGSFLDWGERRLWVIAPANSARHLIPVSQLVRGNPTLASEQIRTGGWVTVSQELAAEHGLRVGEMFTLPSPRPLTLRVAALTTNLGWPPGAVILSSSSYTRGWPNSRPSAYQIQARAGVPIAGVRNRLHEILQSETDLSVEVASEREQRHYALAAQGLSRVTQIRLLILIAAILAVVGAMASMIWQRRDRIAFNKCHGLREPVLWRALLCESAVLLVAGCSIGAIFGLYGQLLGSHYLASVTGFPIVFHVEGTAAISSFALVSIIAFAMLAVPGYLVVRVEPRTVSPAY